MVVREAGIIFRGFTIVYSQYHQIGHGKVDKDLRSGLLSALVQFAETTFEQNSVEYLEGKKFVIAFARDTFISEKVRGPENLLAYAILDQEKNIDKTIQKIIHPVLTNLLKQFKKQFHGKNLSEISQLQSFKEVLDKMFGLDVYTIDQKVKGVFL
ncbi:MAG: hypothetical protein ACTSYC_10405 [Promethearchaeota archaeon]